MYILQTAELLQAKGLRAVTEGWGENCFSSLAKNVENKEIPMYIYYKTQSCCRLKHLER